ncbi:MAG: 2'-5' RNA ligase family protein [Gemmatimonadaceae bacterium]
MRNGVFVVAELAGALRERIADIQREVDPKLARSSPPHVTIIGSSGAGPIRFGTSADELRAAIAPVAADTPPIVVRFGAPLRFMQTEILVLPLDVHGPLRTLHERISASKLSFERARFAFYPHCTLNFYPRLTPERERRLLSLRIDDEFVIDRIQCYETRDPLPSRKALELRLEG